MDYKIFVSFQVSEEQKKLLKKFCEENIDTDYYVSVRVSFTDDMVLSLSMFSQRPEIFFGVYSSKERAIISGDIFDDGLLEDLLEDIAQKNAHATTRKPPRVNADLALAWINYYNKYLSGEVKPYIL